MSQKRQVFVLTLILTLLVIYGFITQNNWLNVIQIKAIEPKLGSSIISDDINITDIVTVSTLQRVDNHLKSLSQLKPNKSGSRLVYADAMLEMTNITIDKESCSEEMGRDLLLIVMVFNRVNNFERRQIIRQTWGQEFKTNNKSRIFFTIALSKDIDVQTKVVKENEEFNDILQFGFYDDYYNCTIKAMALLRWTAMKCPFVKYMLKVDDDSLVIPNNLLDFCRSSDANAIFGYKWHKAYVKRGRDKWSLSLKDYSHNYYPAYISGPYLIPGHYCLALYSTAITRYLPALPFEDVYVTGIVANYLNIKRQKLDSVYHLGLSCDPLSLDFFYYKNGSIFWQRFNDSSLITIWSLYQKSNLFSWKRGMKRCVLGDYK